MTHRQIVKETNDGHHEKQKLPKKNPEKYVEIQPPSNDIRRQIQRSSMPSN